MSKKGVSLAELLAVVVIMGLIAAIAIPLVGRLIEDVEKDAFLGDLITLDEAARLYCISNEEDNYFCDGEGTNNASLEYYAGVFYNYNTPLTGEDLESNLDFLKYSSFDLDKYTTLYIKKEGDNFTFLLLGEYTTTSVDGTNPLQYIDPIDDIEGIDYVIAKNE